MVGDQGTFASMAWNRKGKVTRRERFLAEMDAVIPWQRLIGRIEPHYPKAGAGRQRLGLEKMLRIYFLQQWFNLSDPAAEDAKTSMVGPPGKLRAASSSAPAPPVR